MLSCGRGLCAHWSLCFISKTVDHISVKFGNGCPHWMWLTETTDFPIRAHCANNLCMEWNIYTSLIARTWIWNIFPSGEYLMKYKQKLFQNPVNVKSFAIINLYVQCYRTDNLYLLMNKIHSLIYHNTTLFTLHYISSYFFFNIRILSFLSYLYSTFSLYVTIIQPYFAKLKKNKHW